MDEIEQFLRESNAIEGVFEESAYKQARIAWDWLIKQDVMTTSVILKTHKILMMNQPLRPDEKGYFRKVDVFVGTKKMSAPSLIQARITMEFCFETMRVNPVPDWKKLHILYEDIHPFVDGNGRTGRMFMNWTRLKRCGLPILIIKESERREYYQWFRGNNHEEDSSFNRNYSGAV